MQEDYDNSGLIVGDAEREIAAALICVDVTDEVMDEAAALGAGLIISHHPLIFHALKRLTGQNQVERLAERAIRENIALYACHTNLDAVHGGMSYRLAELLGIENPAMLSEPCSADQTAGFGVVGNLATPVAAEEYIRTVMDCLKLKALRHSIICKNKVQRVAVSSGAGAYLTDAAAAAGADLFITADLKYNDFINADGRLIVADAGHFETEYCAIDLLYDIITKKITTFALHKSAKSRNPVYYTVNCK